MTLNAHPTDGTTHPGNAFTRFMASAVGRVARLTLGGTLVVTGIVLGPPVGLVVAGAGVLPIASGVFNLCPVAPLWGGHFLGSRYCSTSSAQNIAPPEKPQ